LKIFISADMEGISSIVSTDQIFPGGRGYDRARLLMTREVNKVVEAAFECGAHEVLVNDSHHNKDNILIEELDPRSELISGKFRPLSMMQGIDKSFDAVFFVGYHARAGTPEAFLDHTNIFSIINLKINGKLMGEIGMNGRIAGCFGVPVIFVSGDQKAIMCAHEELNQPIGVIVKESISRSSAKVYSFSVVEERLKSGVKDAMKSIEYFQPTIEKLPVKIEVSFYTSNMAEQCLLIPGVIREDARTVSYKSKKFMEAYYVYRIMIELISKID